MADRGATPPRTVADRLRSRLAAKQQQQQQQQRQGLTQQQQQQQQEQAQQQRKRDNAPQVVIEDHVRLAEYLRSSWRSKLQLHRGVDAGNKTVYFFRGKRAVAALLAPEYSEARENGPSQLDKTLDYINTYGKPLRTLDRQPPLPEINDEVDARLQLTKLLQRKLILACERYSTPNNPTQKLIKPSPKQSNTFSEDAYYVWTIDEPPRWATLIAFGILLAVFAACLFPMWPYPLRLGVWYLSMALLAVLGSFLVFCFTVRPAFYFITSYIVPPGIWILPNINEDIDFFAAFKPAWDWHKPDPPKKTAAKDDDAAAVSPSADAKAKDDADES